MRTTLQRLGMSVGLGMVAAAVLAAGPVAAADTSTRTLVGEHEYSYTTYRGDRHGDREGRSWYGGHNQHHRHGIHCGRHWMAGGYETVSHREWVPAHYEEIAVPWEVEWTWIPRHQRRHRHDEHLVVITDDPHRAPDRPNRHEYGRGHWEKRILHEAYTRSEWVPGRYETVERRVHARGHYAYTCRLR